MLKTYLYIPDELDRKIKQAAKRQNKSKAEVIRHALEKGLNQTENKGNAGVEVLFKLVELGKKAKFKGVHDSARMDELLWGRNWSKDE